MSVQKTVKARHFHLLGGRSVRNRRKYGDVIIA